VPRKSGDDGWEQVVIENRALIRRTVHAAAPPAWMREDLEQVALIALFLAWDRYDPSLLVPFGSYAVAVIRNHVRLYLRNAGWSVRVPRRIKVLRREVRACEDDLRATLKREPTIEEVASHLGTSTHAVADAMRASCGLRADPLADVEAQRVADDRDASDRYDAVDHRAVVASLLRALPPDEAFVVRRYYLESFPQTAIAAELGVNQATVSRRLDRALEAMRRRSAEQTARDASALTSGT
jgi:RNA polymerase sigma-B factor